MVYIHTNLGGFSISLDVESIRDLIRIGYEALI
jgi:hypothetical protein